MFIQREMREPEPDIGLCSGCDEFYLLEECPVGMEELEVGGHIHAPVCPSCGGMINEYFYSEENAEVWNMWRNKK